MKKIQTDCILVQPTSLLREAKVPPAPLVLLSPRPSSHIPFSIQNFPDAPGRLGTYWSVRVGDYGMGR